MIMCTLGLRLQGLEASSSWVAVKELSLDCYIGETPLLYIYIYIYIPLW